MKNIFFSSDLHLGHSKIIEHCNRPFTSVDEMDTTLINNWNNKVSKKDIVYFLGDFAFRNAKSVPSYLEYLYGEIHIIWGNHDHKVARKYANMFSSCHELLELKIDNQLIVMCHYAMRTWRNSNRGSIHLYGHSHGNLPPTFNSMDVGVDCHNFSPISLEEVCQKINKNNETISEFNKLLDDAGKHFMNSTMMPRTSPLTEEEKTAMAQDDIDAFPLGEDGI